MIETPIAGVDDLEDVSPHCELGQPRLQPNSRLSDAEFNELCLRIQWHINELRRMNAIHRRETGRDYVMEV